MKVRHPICWGLRCVSADSEVRRLTSARTGSTRILCRECWEYENSWRAGHARVHSEWHHAEVPKFK